MQANIPEFPHIPDLKGHECAKYARLAAEEIFGIVYNKDHAWNMRYKNPVLWNSYLSKITWKKVAQPGHLLGMFNPKSKHTTEVTKEVDCKGHTREYTHMSLYVGNGIVFHQLGPIQKMDSLEELIKNGFRVIEVIGPPEESARVNQIL